MRGGDVESMEMGCSHYFPWQLILVMLNWLLIGTALHESGTRTSAWLGSSLSKPSSHSLLSADSSSKCTSPSLGLKPGPDQGLHMRQPVESSSVSGMVMQVQGTVMHGHRDPQSKSWPLLDLGELEGATYMKIPAKAFNTLTTSQAYAGHSSLGKK